MLTPRHTNSVPRMLEPRKLAAQGKSIAGLIAPDNCLRLLDAVERIRSPLSVELLFYRDEQNRIRLEGKVGAEVSSVCQRCLEELNISLEADIARAVVFSDEEMRILPRELDPWMLQGEAGDIIALLEDELIVSLPIVSCHPEGECGFPSQFGPAKDDAVSEKQDNPFNILEQLKERTSETN